MTATELDKSHIAHKTTRRVEKASAFTSYFANREMRNHYVINLFDKCSKLQLLYFLLNESLAHITISLEPNRFWNTVSANSFSFSSPTYLTMARLQLYPVFRSINPTRSSPRTAIQSTCAQQRRLYAGSDYGGGEGDPKGENPQDRTYISESLLFQDIL